MKKSNFYFTSGGPRDDREVVVASAAAPGSRQPPPDRPSRGREVEREASAGQPLRHVLLGARRGGVADVFDAGACVVPTSNAANVGGFSFGEFITIRCPQLKVVLYLPLPSLPPPIQSEGL